MRGIEWLHQDGEVHEMRTAIQMVKRDPMDETKLVKAICDVLRQVANDMDEGTIPRGVRSFADMHDYVDANEYVSMLLDDADFDLVDLNTVASVVDTWLRLRPRAA